MRAVVYIEWNGFIRSTDRNVFIKSFHGSKYRDYKRRGRADDDWDFAIRFLRTCRWMKPDRGIAIVRDKRVKGIILRLLEWGFRDLKDRVKVYLTPRFWMNREDMERFIVECLIRELGEAPIAMT
ncbi:MAG: hypothetical protein DRJ47_06640 [Thermoprotei archaeon]|nr:MAG: hypothetical protein DRJ47_06640 [Thermoprotei archaeon]